MSIQDRPNSQDVEALLVLPDLRTLIHHVVRQIVGSAHADDVTQDTLIQLWRQAGRYDPARGTFEQWARTIARRRAIDFTRSQHATLRRNTSYEQRNQRQVPCVEDVVCNRSVVTAALAQLSTRHRRLLQLVYYADYTGQEVADAERIPLGTAKSRIREGLAQLRSTQHQMHPDEDRCDTPHPSAHQSPATQPRQTSGDSCS